MKDKIETLFDYIKNLCEADLDRIICFVLGIVSVNLPSPESKHDAKAARPDEAFQTNTSPSIQESSVMAVLLP